ncbi:MAG: hypothetical protein GXC73_14515 [Chitinophagaceae bacterium]|nr:hypothetical protein [Chitinophagaceae bacterium]
MFGQLSEQYKNEQAVAKLPPETLLAAAKISKGENYEGLPYVMLDYPRCFGKEDTLAIRTFFWWGNFFSITLQLKGKYLQQYAPVIKQNWTLLLQEDAWINVSDEEWQHHFRENNMIPVADMQQQLADKKILKLAFKCKLEDWDSAETKLLRLFQLLLRLLQ